MSERFNEFYSGNAKNAYELLGCHRKGDGFLFAVWAPNAHAVSVVGDFNGWDASADKMSLVDGIWQKEISSVDVGSRYKFAVWGNNGFHLKSDPYAFFSEVRPDTASVVYESKFRWSDKRWINKQIANPVYSRPVNVYEVHLGSWMRHPDGSLYTYRQLAETLVPYVCEMGYTHVEFLPLAEHPFDGSWGYQVTGFYSPTSRYGQPDDLKYLVNEFHKAGIGVLLDWVPAHFCKDEHGLYEFDGTFCYEPSDEFRRENKGWGTRAFDYARYEVQSFLVSNAVYWLKEFHFDGLRVDAVASMLYLDYERKDGEWRANVFGGNYNLEAINLLQKVSACVFEACPYALFVAEESTAFPKVTAPTYVGGLGFNYKWNMGWMNDVLEYEKVDPLFRIDHHYKLTFSMCYAFGENYFLPLSHDEVVHLKGSLLNKMWGTYDQKFAGLKTLLGLQYAHPGKKLNFMGSELATWDEWNENRELAWNLLTFPKHDDHKRFVRDLNFVYKTYAPLYENDSDWNGFAWVNEYDAKDSVIAFRRIDKKGDEVFVVLNFSPQDYFDFGFWTSCGDYRCVIASEDAKYGGRGVVTPSFSTDEKGYVQLSVPAYSAQYFFKSARKRNKK